MPASRTGPRNCAVEELPPQPARITLTFPSWRRVPALAWRTSHAPQAGRRRRLRAVLSWPFIATRLLYARATRALLAHGGEVVVLAVRWPRPPLWRDLTAEASPWLAAAVVYAAAGLLVRAAVGAVTVDRPAYNLIPLTLWVAGLYVFLQADTSSPRFTAGLRRYQEYDQRIPERQIAIWWPRSGSPCDRRHLLAAITRYADASTVTILAVTTHDDALDYLRAGFRPAPHISPRVVLRPPRPTAAPPMPDTCTTPASERDPSA